uniref:Very-long-chain 3-oxoacyl-CoA reductase n=1 Tax=Myotis myotis TaxID=51298 RepID=A0A7J7VHX7_MYOMY|nr:hydroxysteroid 17-beta dehydrogenase 12 [Myotis myotis]
MLNVNILSVCKMTHLVLPGMVERSKGVILNISSASGMNPFPLLTIYSATKGFVDFFSQCIHEEYKSKGIFVQSVLPFFVATKMSKIRKPSLTVPTSGIRPNSFIWPKVSMTTLVSSLKHTLKSHGQLLVLVFNSLRDWR